MKNPIVATKSFVDDGTECLEFSYKGNSYQLMWSEEEKIEELIGEELTERLIDVLYKLDRWEEFVDCDCIYTNLGPIYEVQ